MKKDIFFLLPVFTYGAGQSIKRIVIGLDNKKYNLQNNFLGFNSKPAIPIVATRGCPYSCFNYCTYPLQQGLKVRFRSI